MLLLLLYTLNDSSIQGSPSSKSSNDSQSPRNPNKLPTPSKSQTNQPNQPTNQPTDQPTNQHYKIGHEIRYWRSRAKTQHREISEVGCYDKCCTNEYTEKRQEKLLEKRALIEQQMNEMERQTTRERNTWIPLSAFVSFDTERDYQTALQDMKFSVPKRLFHFIR